MAADLGLLPLNQLAQSQQHQQQQEQNPNLAVGSWMWNTTQNQDDDDSWEVRAFAQDTGNIMGTTWPPRSYTCTFCRREFRSAQALGGHMNVHRRDRARLRQSPPTSTTDPPLSSASPSALIFPSQEFVANGGLCLLYSLPSPNSVFNSPSLNGCMESPSTLLSISPYQTNNFMSNTAPLNFSTTNTSLPTDKLDQDYNSNGASHEEIEEGIQEELDLELRLGSRPLPPRHKQDMFEQKLLMGRKKRHSDTEKEMKGIQGCKLNENDGFFKRVSEIRVQGYGLLATVCSAVSFSVPHYLEKSGDLYPWGFLVI